MAEILGVGITHYPPLLGEPDSYANLLRLVLNSPHIPPEMKQQQSWPDGMVDEWNDEHEIAVQHQQRHREALQTVRQAIDDFAPDAVIIFGDDQYENFKEDVIPPFNVYCMDSFPSKPFAMLDALGGGTNIWNVDNSHTYDIPGAGHIAVRVDKPRRRFSIVAIIAYAWLTAAPTRGGDDYRCSVRLIDN